MVRTLSALILGLTLSLTAAAQRADPPPVKTSTQACGGYTLTLRENGFDDPTDRVTLGRAGTAYASVEDTAVAVDWCRDVTGDGVPEVLLSGFSGGAHCCFTHTLYSLTTPPKKLLTAFSAHAETLNVEQLDGRGPHELIGWDWRFAYGYGLSFAESAPLPVVYSFLDGQYVDNSRAFPGVIRRIADGMNGEEPFGGGYLAGYAARLITGTPAEAAAYAAEQPERVRAWLENYGPDIRLWLGDYGLTDWPTRAGAAADAPRAGLGGAFSAPGRREYLAVVGTGREATLRLYRAEGDGVLAGPVLERQPLAGEFYDLKRWPAAPVRRTGGRDDVLLRDTRSGSVRYVPVRLSGAALTELRDDALAPLAAFLGDLDSVAQHVASQYASKERTDAQRAEVQRRVAASVARAGGWMERTNVDFALTALGTFGFDAVELSTDGPDRARATLPVTVGFTDQNTDSEYIGGERYTLSADLERGPGGWALVRWGLEQRGGEWDEE